MKEPYIFELVKIIKEVRLPASGGTNREWNLTRRQAEEIAKAIKPLFQKVSEK